MTPPQDSQTWKEIAAQPRIWSEWGPPLAKHAGDVRDWIARLEIEEIVFAGAGTSAFIGEIVSFAPPGRVRLRAIPTTDIVSCPLECLRDDPRLLVAQFGRSGDSSETVGALELLDSLFPRAHRLNITCNPIGALATRPSPGPGAQRTLVLPSATHDSGFAMTSSFTTMLLSAMACLDAEVDVASRLTDLSQRATALIRTLAQRTPKRPDRAIFLGSGALKGLARESALKALELTAGWTVTSWDSLLGFRHGPKAAIIGKDLVVAMIHPDHHTARYDADVAKEIRYQFPEATVLTMGGDADIALGEVSDARWDAVLYVLAAQVWAVTWSAELGLNIDNPFADSGNLSRVVSGVTLYPVSR
jgi:tagatose-6-phosphate ketose/aldose isomerase